MINKLSKTEELHQIEKTKSRFKRKLKEVKNQPKGDILIQTKDYSDEYTNIDPYGPKEKSIEFTPSLLIEYLDSEITDLEKRANEIIESLYNSI